MKTFLELEYNGLVMRGYHHKSNSKKIIVMFHGFTGNKTESGYLFRKLSDRLENENIDSIRFDYFGSGESDGKFSEMTLDFLLEQANYIFKYVKSLDYEELYMLGFSMGGALAVNLLKNADKTVLIAPAIEFHKHDKGSKSSLVLLDSGNYDLNGYELNKNLFSSFTKDYNKLAEEYKKPVLIIQGSKDAAVKHNEVEKFSKNFENCKFELIENGAHTFNNREHYIFLEEKIVEFLIK